MRKLKRTKYKDLKSEKKLLYRFSLITIFLLAVFLGNIFANAIFKKPPIDTSVSPASNAQQIDDRCRDSTDKSRCYPQEFYTLTQKSSFENALKILTAIQRINPSQTRGCHFIAHKISQAETEKGPEKWLDVIKKVSPSLCTGGFIHGVLESHMAIDPNFEINRKTTDMICRDLFPEGSFGRRSCYHNLGHLLLVQTEDSIPEAIKVCNSLELYMPRYECLSGAFMENITTENLVAHGLRKQLGKWDLETARKTEELCAKFEGLASRACWKEISYLYFPVSNNDPRKLYEECQRAPDQVSRDECFVYGAGNLIHTARFREENLRNLCHQFTQDNPLFQRCMNNVIGSMITGSLDNVERATNLCSETYDSYKKTCFSMVLKALTRNNAPEKIIEDTCSKASSDIRIDLCKS